jgi:hypothetical protein
MVPSESPKAASERSEQFSAAKFHAGKFRVAERYISELRQLTGTKHPGRSGKNFFQRN